MKKLSFVAGASAIALALASIFPAAGVFANTIATSDFEGSPITLRRTVSGVSNNVTNTFGYTITSTSTPDGGSANNAPTTASIAFSNKAPSSNEVSGTTTVDFGTTNFSKVGDYTFTISETSSTDPTNYPIDTASNDYTAIVRVTYYVDPVTNVPDNSRYVAKIVINNKDDTKVAQATWGSSAARTYIEVAATTTGNMAETDKCFAYTINIPVGSGVSAGDTYAINANTTCTGSDTSVTAGTPATIYLKHGDTATVGLVGNSSQLPVGANYTLTKTGTDDGYTTKIDGNVKTTINKITVATGNTDCESNADGEGCFDENNHTDFENNKQADPLTGIVTNFWFYLMLLIIGLVGFFIISRKRKEEENQ